jgi:LacI family transcriptional regulator
MTAKELAKQLGVSEAAVSFALNDKPGVSTITRNRIKEAALAAGMNLTNLNQSHKLNPICLIYYRKNGAVLTDTSFFESLTKGVEDGCNEEGYHVNYVNVYSPSELEYQLETLSMQKAAGVIIMGTEMQDDSFKILAFTTLPVVMLDNHFLSSKIDSITIANADGAYLATNYLINKKKCTPGYLHSSYYITNFAERRTGYFKALTYNGMSKSSAIIHELTPSIDGASYDMSALIENGETLASCYFADNDLIAIGAMRAFKEHGYRIPEDISIIGFDDISLCNYTEPGLTTVHVPKHYMGMLAANRLISTIRKKATYPVNIQISTHLVIRHSIG